VAKKPKPHVLTPAIPTVLYDRVQRAMQEDRYQHALELARQLVKANPQPANRELLQEAILGRARQLSRQGRSRDALTTLEHAAQHGNGDASWLEKLAEELARCGGAQRALAILEKLPESLIRSKVLGLAADWAMQDQAAGHWQLPAQLQSQRDLIVQAFRQVQAGQDDQARQTVQGIGLQSPFLEWKLLLRGFLAYYQKDDVRALENWQRLDPERLPARLAAPFRFQIDAAFRQSQPAETQTVLKRLVDRVQSAGLVPLLRNLQSVLAHPEQLAQAFRLAESFLPALRQEAPQMVPRLAACFFWTIAHQGQPEDMMRYKRVFGAPADDPDLSRLHALLYERVGDLAGAHAAWQDYERSVAANSGLWPSGTAERARALIWWRMGENAASMPGLEDLKKLPRFLRDHPARPELLDPPAEKCYERSIGLAPDQLDAHTALLDYYSKREQPAKAEHAARRLLKHFPDHVPTLTTLASLRSRAGDHAQAITLLQEALKINPLDRRLRSELAAAHLFHARDLVDRREFASARSAYQTSLDLDEGRHCFTALCKWAACEFKAGDVPRAEELVQQALARAGEPLPVAYAMLVESICFKLARPLKERLDREFAAGLAQPPSGRAAAELMDIASALVGAKVRYHGQKSHEKKVLAYLEKAAKAPFEESELEAIVRALFQLDALKVLRKYVTRGKRQFPRNPHFYFYEAESYINRGPMDCPIPKVQQLLNKTQELARALPPGDERDALLDLVQERQKMIAAHGALTGPGFLDVLSEIFGAEEDDDVDYDSY
jgi:tetratricopeptide (TPR) repeat protein